MNTFSKKVKQACGDYCYPLGDCHDALGLRETGWTKLKEARHEIPYVVIPELGNPSLLQDAALAAFADLDCLAALAVLLPAPPPYSCRSP